MKITFTKKSIKAINKWLKRHNIYAECKLVNKGELEFNPNNYTILIPREYDDSFDSHFMKFLRGLGLTSDFDTVTLSILHEVGHAQTTHLFSEKEWRWCAAQKAIWAGLHEGPDEEYLFGYWNFEDELAANNWLVLYIKAFPKKVQKLEDIIEENVKFG